VYMHVEKRQDALLSPPAAEKQISMLDAWSLASTSVNRRMCIHHVFESQVIRTPGAAAVADSATTLSYRVLDAEANRLAQVLQAYGVGPEQRVALCLERSVGFVVAALATLKAGGAYVPLDPALPPARLSFLLSDSQASVLLSQESLLGRLPSDATLPILCLDRDADRIAAASSAAPNSLVSPDNLAYVIYTSGSTGTPKGVAISHAQLANLVAWHQHAFAVQPSDRASQLAGLGFDAAVWELWPYLTAGAAVLIPDEATRADLPALLAWLAAESISISFLPTPLAEAALSQPWPETMRLRVLLTGGDQLQRYPSKSLPCALVNNYGPTETTVVATSTVVLPEGAGLPSIGRAIANTQTYLLDEQMQPVANGEAGELYLGGASVARGYWQRPELSAERFLPDPFSEQPGARMYRTGDLARYRADGELDYLGRIDQQVKVRGFRIELGEIAAALMAHEAVREAIAIARDDGPAGGQAVKRLVAYVVAETADAELSRTLRAFVAERLPEYMVPSAVVLLDALPLTTNGKVDRKALPAPDLSHAGGADFVAPRSAAESAVAEIWADVLKIAPIGVHDNFFALGGHSLLAGQVLARLREVFQDHVTIQMMFEQPTIAELVVAIAEQTSAASADYLAQLYLDRKTFSCELHDTVEAPALSLDVQRPASGKLPLSFAQQRLWLIERFDPGNLSYLVPQTVHLTGPLDMAALERSFNDLVQRHESLRTVFRLIDEQAVQVVQPSVHIPLPLVDLEALDRDEQALGVQQLSRLEAQRPFDLATGPLLRTTLLRLGGEEHILLLTLHHIVIDDWSLSIFWRELTALYRSHVTGQAAPLNELTLHYPDAAIWQREWLSGAVLEAQTSYWQQQLRGCSSILHLPTDRPRPAKQSFCGARETIVLPKSLSCALADLAQREGATLFMTLLATFQVLLQRYSGQSDFVIGTPISNRRRREFEDLIGFFINTLALRADVAPELSFRELLKRVRATALGAFVNQDLPFEQVVELAQPERDPSRNPLFQVMFALQNAPRDSLYLEGLQVEVRQYTGVTAQFDLFLEMIQVQDGLQTCFEYNTDLFDAATIARMLGHFQTLLESVVADPDRRVSTLSMLPASEQRQIVVEWNATHAAYPEDWRLHELVEAQVARTPHAIAAIFEGQALSYAELNSRANQLAHHLQRLGVGPDVAVGICIERSLEMVIGVLAVLKAGGAYLPLDPAYPKERLTFMLADTQAPVLLTQQHLLSLLPPHNAHTICLDTDWPRIAYEPTWPASNSASADNLAYLIYTSGSTGRPKGVAMPQRPLLNLMAWQVQQWNPAQPATTLQFASLSFDVSFQEIFSTWCTGGTLVLISAETRQDSAELLKVLERESVERIFLPFVALQFLAEAAEQQTTLPGRLREIITAGEQLQMTPAIVRMLQRLGNCTLHNHYGPSETHVVTAHDLVGDPATWAALPPIGRPISNSQMYVLDQHLRPTPVGIPGELYIGGDGVARGYLKRPELTAEKFIPDPFSDIPGARLYKTGDLARYLPNGEIAFMGRIDHQVKVRGFRVELGEIEALLQQHPGVRECVVVVREDNPGDKRVVAYVVAQHGADVTAGDVTVFLRDKLPEYMVPSAVVLLDALPLTPNSKVDRRALPKPAVAKRDDKRTIIPPRTPLEAQLAGLWAELFGLEEVSIDDHFFALGGHSLLAIRLTAQIKATFGLDLPLRDLFLSPTVAGCAQAIEAARHSSAFAQASDPLVELIADTALDFAIRPVPHADWFTAAPKALFLTGATGFLGAFMLHDLLHVTNAEIFCLVRAKTGRQGMERIKEVLLQYHLWDDAMSERIVPVLGDLSQERLGLSEAEFAALANKVEGIYHSGALVSFIYPYAALKAANVLGTQEVIRLACQGKLKPLHYVSTIAVATTARRSVDGRVYEDATLGAIDSIDSGYVQTKWVSEHLLMAARERGLPVSIYRPGRISGHSMTGASNSDDFISRLLMGWLQLGIAPEINMVENFAPVDFVAQTIVHLSLQRETIGQTFHVLNPEWSDFRTLACTLRGMGYPVTILPYAEWHARLFAAAQNENDNVLYPLLSFLRALPTENDWVSYLQMPGFDCRNTLNGLANSSIVCPSFGPQHVQAIVAYLIERSMLPLGAELLSERAVEPAI
jgi:amino acid adenylation domain-containing protein/thioester reductase-like protein